MYKLIATKNGPSGRATCNIYNKDLKDALNTADTYQNEGYTTKVYDTQRDMLVSRTGHGLHLTMSNTFIGGSL